MAFPIYYEGKILFRDGMPAFSGSCCCGGYSQKSCLAVHLPASGQPDLIPDGLSPPLFGDDQSRVVYQGRVYDIGSDPQGSNYHTYLWILEFCHESVDDAENYRIILENWAAVDASIAWTGSENDVGLQFFAVKMDNCSDESVQDMIDAYLIAPEAYAREVIMPLIPRDMCPESTEVFG